MSDQQQPDTIPPREKKRMLALGRMVVESTQLHYKAMRFKSFCSLDYFTGLPSYREVQIQIEKLARMTYDFQEKFTLDVILSLPEDKADKIVGLEVHRLRRQSRAVDRMCATMMEEMVWTTIAKPAGFRKLPNVIKIKTQKFIEFRNRQSLQDSDKALRCVLDDAARHVAALRPSA